MNNLNTEIEQRLNDPLWELRMAKAVTQNLKSKKKQLWVSRATAASIGFVLLLGAFSYVSVFSPETGFQTSQPKVNNDMELPIEWAAINNFPIEEDEEITLFLTIAY